MAFLAAGIEGDFRLVNKTEGATAGAESGVLEVFHAGAWGSVCISKRQFSAPVVRYRLLAVPSPNLQMLMQTLHPRCM